MSIRVCIAGVTGWTGTSIARAVLDAPDFQLVSALARGAAGQSVTAAIGHDADSTVTIVAEPAEALAAGVDVWIDYTHPSAVKGHTVAALEAGVSVVIGTSGLSASDYADIEEEAVARGMGVIAAGNFSITAALMKHFAGIAATYVPHWEIIDYAHAHKPDAPSGTAQELADALGEKAENLLDVPVSETLGHPGTRGAEIGGAQVHSVRLPGYVLSVEALFGLPHERLTMRLDAGSGAEPYVGGTLLAARKVGKVTGLVRGLDTLLFR